MATPRTETPSINIAGDFSARGVDIAPDDISSRDFETEADELGEMQDIAPRAPIGGVSKKMAENERAFRESIKSATGQSSLGQEATRGLVNPSGDANVNTDWPVDQ